MKKFLVASIAAAAFYCAPALAADMPVKAPPAPMWNWNGFYLGAHLGYDWESFNFSGVHTDTGLPGATGPFSGSFHDDFAGFQAGYNYMISPNILLGVEVDASSNKGSYSRLGANDGSFGSYVLGWSGTARGRIGYAANNVLFYGTGGFAWGDVNLTRVQIAAGNSNAPIGTVENVSTTHTGWTVGGGVEVGVMPNLTVKAEYRHIDYGTFNVSFPLQNRTWFMGTRSEEVLLGINYYFGSH
jgi:outer membrane immunogenic protein